MRFSMKKSRENTGTAGFTLVELLIVIAILAILSVATTSLVSNNIEKSRENVLEANLTTFSGMVSMYSIDYPKSEWYDAWNHDGDGSLNNFLELELEIINEGHYENNVTMANPVSKKKSILDYDKTLSSGDGYQPAVFLTNNANYSWEGTGNTQNIIGTIVAFFKVTGGTTEYIELYYVKPDGTKSERTIRLN